MVMTVIDADGHILEKDKDIRSRKDISERAKEKILGENTKRFYGWGQ